MKKRLLCFMAALSMLISCMTGFTAAAEEECLITVETVQAVPGSTVDVIVSVENNPGIMGATFKVSWDDTLTLAGSECGEAFSMLSMTRPSNNKNGGNFVFYAEDIADEDIIDGDILVLTFEVSEDATFGSSYFVDLSYKSGDVFDKNLDPIAPTVKNGAVEISYNPGDVNSDTKINALDLILICRYIADDCITDPDGYNVVMNAPAADVNADNKINALDLILICRYIADDCTTDPDGYNVTLEHSELTHRHIMEEYAEKEATCNQAGNKAYWYCTSCKCYYSDAEGTTPIEFEDTIVTVEHIPSAEATCTADQICILCGATIVAASGHNTVTIPGYAPTYEATGLTDGVKCETCGEWIQEQTIIDPLKPDEYSIDYKYQADAGNEWLKNQEKINPNPTKYTTQGNRILLEDAEVPGYTFNGWYDKNGTKWDEIPTGSSGNLILYGDFSLIEYTITFDSPDIPGIFTYNGSNKYTVDTGTTLVNPKQYGYTFIGWSDNNGFIVDSIPAGTTGNITLHANWTSNRNKATSYSNYGAPIIIEDEKHAQFLFVYDIGRIDNVPLYPYLDENGEPIGVNGSSLDINVTKEITQSFTSEEAKEVTSMIADSTTRSSGWTLSTEWSEIYNEGNEYNDKQVKTEERVDSQGNTVGGNFFVSNSAGGSSFSSVESGSSISNSAKVTTDKSFGISQSYTDSEEKYCSAKLGTNATIGANLGLKVPLEGAELSAGLSSTISTNSEVTSGRKDTQTYNFGMEASKSIGTEQSVDASETFNATASITSNWNTDTGYEKSYESSIETTISDTIASEIAKTTSYNISKALGGDNSETETISGTTSNEKGYSNSLTVSKYISKTTTKTIKYTNSDVGYYRVVMAGTIHVYGVVGYDVATSSYYVYTYNVLEDDTFEYLDYSLKSATFDDCENGMVLFEIPYEVNEYIAGITGSTNGLEYSISEPGTITAFEYPEDFDGTIIVPQYYSVDNLDNTYSAFKTTAFTKETFKGNTEIETVILPLYVTEIPDNAFEGCTNLKNVYAYGVTSIGDHAFKGCENLEKFSVDNMVTHVGEGAFEGVPSVSAMAYDSTVADAILSSGAASIELDLTMLADSFDNRTIEIPATTKYFGLIGGGKEFSNLNIKSEASEETFISNLILKDNTTTPLDISSPTVTLARLTVKDAPGFAMVLRSDDTNLKLLGAVSLLTRGENSVISKNVALSKANASVAGELTVNGKYLVCGEVTKTSMLDGTIKTLTADEYTNYLTSSIVLFNANGGEIATTDSTKVVYYEGNYGDLPTPTREHYDFVGWYTLAEGGKQITSESEVDTLSTIELYAHWTPKTVTIYFDANGGNVSQTEKNATYGGTYGTLPTPTKDYHVFDGWYTNKDTSETGSKITDSTIIDFSESKTLYAHWRPGDISQWVLASSVPTGAEIVNRKYSYTLTHYTTVDSEASSYSLGGWTQYNCTSRWSDWLPWSDWLDFEVYASDAREVTTRQVVSYYEKKTQYRYSRYLNSSGANGYSYSGGARCYPISSGYCTYGPYYSDWVDAPYKTKYSWDLSSSGYAYGGSATSTYCSRGLEWYNQETRQVDDTTKPVYRTQWCHRDRYLIYTYFFYRNENLESTSYPSGNNISNIQEWVQYRAK